MNLNDNEEQERIFDKTLKSAYEFCDEASKLNPEYQEKLVQTLLGFEGIIKFVGLMENMK